MLERIEKIEDDINILRYTMEMNEKYIVSETEKTLILNQVIQSITRRMKETNERLLIIERDILNIKKSINSRS